MHAKQRFDLLHKHGEGTCLGSFSLTNQTAECDQFHQTLSQKTKHLGMRLGVALHPRGVRIKMWLTFQNDNYFGLFISIRV